VNEIYEDWEESYFRERKFVSPQEAARCIGRKEIRAVLQRFSEEVD
jgi:hypothetical protein